MDHTQYSDDLGSGASETFRNAKQKCRQVAGQVTDSVRRNPAKTILLSAATIGGVLLATWMRRRRRS
jgi:hypothetical protein